MQRMAVCPTEPAAALPAKLALFEAVRVAAESVRAEQKSLACPCCRADLVETGLRVLASWRPGR